MILTWPIIRGKYIEIVPTGIAHLTFEQGDHYTWTKVTTVVNNIIVGKVRCSSTS